MGKQLDIEYFYQEHFFRVLLNVLNLYLFV